MIRSLKDILVVSDMDNTLLTPEDGVPFVNQVTMRLFCALGGVRCIGAFSGSGRGDYDRGRRHLRGAGQ